MTCRASRCMPTTESDAAEYWKCRPQKYRPGSESTMPRRCSGSPPSPSTGRSSHGNDGLNPVHHSTLATSSTSPSAVTGFPSETDTMRATSSRHCCDVPWLDSDQRGLASLGTILPAHRRAQGQHVLQQDEHAADQHVAGEPRLDAERDDRNRFAGDDDVPRLGQIHRDVRAAVAEADDQHRAVRELARCPVVRRVELDDGRVELAREGGRLGTRVARRRHDDVRGP